MKAEKIENKNQERPRIPAALIVLKANSGANWDGVKKQLLKFLDYKRKISKLSISDHDKFYLSLLVYNDYKEIPAAIRGRNFKSCAFKKEKLVSYYFNTLATLHKLDYDSYLVCYIQDSFNTVKSGNTKYPNL